MLNMHVDFTVGHWTHKANRKNTISPPRKKEGVGDQYVSDNSVWFEGCGCKKGVIPVINRWENSQPTEVQIGTVAKTIRNKNKEVDFEVILQSLTSFVEKLHDQD